MKERTLGVLALRGTAISTLEPKYLFCLFAVLMFSILDGTFTIILIEKGAWEANPVMRFALSIGNEFFFFLKYFLTASGLLFLLKNGRLRIFNGKIVLEDLAYGIVIMYEALIIYEIALLHFIV